MKRGQGVEHLVFGTPLDDNVADGHDVAYFAMGCFWGAERCFWLTQGVTSTSVGYMGGVTESPRYVEVCSGETGHAETVRVVFDPERVSYAELLVVFFESHDPTQNDRQGNDVGSQYRSALFTTSLAQANIAHEVVLLYDKELARYGRGPIVTEVSEAGAFIIAENCHQQYLSANPLGYCGLEGTNITCPVPRSSAARQERTKNGTLLAAPFPT